MGAGASAQQGGQVVTDPELQRKHSELAVQQSDLEKKFNRHVQEFENKLRETLIAEAQRIEGVIEQRAMALQENLIAQAQEQSQETLKLQEAIEGPLLDAIRRIEAVEPQLLEFRRELDQVSTSAASARQEMRNEIKAELESAKAASEKQASELEQRMQTPWDEQGKENKSLRADLAEAFERCEALQASIRGLEKEQEVVHEQADKAHEELMQEIERLERVTQEKMDDLQDTTRADTQRSLDHFEEQRKLQASMLNDVEAVVQSNSQAIKLCRTVAESVHSRSMTWRLKSFHKRLAALLSQEEDVCFQSPNFTVCALPELRLELQVGARDGGGSLDTAVPLPCVPVPVPGSCTVRLWAPAGMYLSFRTTIGEGANAVSKRFEYTFKPEVSAGLPDEQGRYCFVMQNFVQLDSVWVRATDTIQVVLDLLEFKCAPMPVGQSFEVTYRPAQTEGPIGTPDEAGSAAGEASPTEGGCSPVPDEDRRPSFLQSSGPFGPLGGADVDDMAFARSGTSEVLLEERVRNELQAIRNRSVRRVEWRLEGVQRMIDVCKIGEAVESPAFCAAGLERIVFHFYPKGYDVNPNAGVLTPCALFISGPVRTTVRGMLWVGSLSRQLEHRFRGKGDTGGRNKFGPLETQVDATDTILIALEIADVETDLPDSSASLVLRDAGDKGGSRGIASPTRGNRAGQMSGEASPIIRPSERSTADASPVSFGKGTLKAKREDPTKTEELVKCVSLPTLNARQLHMPLVKGRKAGAIGC